MTTNNTSNIMEIFYRIFECLLENFNNNMEHKEERNSMILNNDNTENFSDFY